MKVKLIGSGMIEIPPKGYGAVEKHIWNVYRSLQRKNVSVEILNKVFLKNALGEYLFALYALIKTLRFDGVIHVHTTGVGFVFSLFKRKFVYTSHSRHWISYEGVRERTGARLERYVTKRCSYLIVLSDKIFEMIDKKEKVVIPNGVDLELYKPDFNSRSGTEIVCVGALEKHKNFHIIAEALKNLKLHITIIGPIKDKDYADLLRSYSNVELKGEVTESEIASILAHSDLFAHPSESEALSMAVIEAMASGLPIIGSEVNITIIENKNGFKVPVNLEDPKKIELYRDYILKLIQNTELRKEFSNNSRSMAESRYSWDAVSSELMKIYDKTQNE